MNGRWMALVAAVLGSGVVATAQTNLVPLECGRLAGRYQPDPAPMKPYVKELFSPSGVSVTIDSPADHFHHHGLMFAIGADGTDFWTELPLGRHGRQVPRAADTRIVANGLKQTIDWLASNGTPVLVESRGVRLPAAQPGQPNVLTWVSVLEPAGTDPVKLWGRHYFGLGMRFPADMDAKAGFVFPEGTETGRVVRSDETLRRADWCAVHGTLGGKPVTVVQWDHPANPRRALWFTMSKPFSYLSATLNLEAEPATLKPGGKWVLRYGVAVFDGAADAAQIEAARNQWLKEEAP